MPPTPFTYAPNQLHQAQRFGPICMQRFPIDLALEPAPLKTQSSSGDVEGATTSWRLQMNLMRKVVPHSLFTYLRPLISRLVAFEQSEDCLNLNIYTPIEGKQWAPGDEQRAGHHLRPARPPVRGCARPPPSRARAARNKDESIVFVV